MRSQRISEQAFTAAKSELPMLYVFLGLATCELLVVHFLVSRWSITGAWVLSFLTLLFLIQFGMIVRRVRHQPTLVTSKALIVRSGKGIEQTIAWDRIASITGTGFGPAPSGPDVLRAAIIAHPNVKVTLATPISMRLLGRTRDISIVALRVDDPAALIGSVQRALDEKNTISPAFAETEAAGETRS